MLKRRRTKTMHSSPTCVVFLMDSFWFGLNDLERSSKRKIMRSLISILLIVLLRRRYSHRILYRHKWMGCLTKMFSTASLLEMLFTFTAPPRYLQTKKRLNDLTKMLPVDRCCTSWRTWETPRRINGCHAGMEMTTSLQSVSAESFGDLGFLWKVVYDIRPAQGGATGVWPRFIRYVKPDGSLINPEHNICSRKLVAEDIPLFSVMSFDDLSIDSDSPQIDGEEALRIARESIEKDLCCGVG